MNVRLHTPCRALITPKACPYFKLKSVLEILYYLLLLKVLKLLCNSYAKNENCVLLQLCLIFGSISKLVIVQAETPIFWPPHVKSWLIGKDPDAGRDWGQEEKATTEDEMAGWHHRLGHEFEWTPGVGDGQGGLACCSLWSCKESDDWAIELNWTELNWIVKAYDISIGLN